MRLAALHRRQSDLPGSTSSSHIEIVVVDDGSKTSHHRKLLVRALDPCATHSIKLRIWQRSGRRGMARRCSNCLRTHGRRRSKNSRTAESAPPGQISPWALARYSLYLFQAGWSESVLGTIFNALVRRRHSTHQPDTQCEFKLFQPVGRAQDLFQSPASKHTLILSYSISLAKRGYRIAEVPVNWADQPGPSARWIVMLRELMASTTQAIGPAIEQFRIEPAFASEPSPFFSGHDR